MSEQPLYLLEGVTRSYTSGGPPALDCPGLAIKKGGVTGISGPNGSGKSTLLKLLAFTEKPTTGHIYFEGQEEEPFSTSIRHRVTLLPQIPFLLNRSVFENVSYGLNVKGEKKGIRAKVHHFLETVGLDPDRFCRRSRQELSGGEAQRVALAARLALDPDVLILDEPTASVDAASSHLIRQAVLSFAERPGKTVILTSHDGAWLADVSQEICFFFRGKPLHEKMGFLLFGPFKQAEKGRWLYAYGDGRDEIEVPPPPREGTVAAFPESILRLGGSPEEGEAAFEAVVREVAWRDGIVGAQVTLSGAGHAMTLLCRVDRAPEPGTRIKVIYPLSGVVWL
ncbi:MAG: energy-coupling factor ABC transporter ATP-binding protein [Desulfobacterales bacterium]|nr:energy-coupling factor ABC transporter ATP-binding protein [Desulfobacterales bacterium]